MKIPEGVTVEVGEGRIKVSGPNGSLERSFNKRKLKATTKDGEVEFELLQKATRNNNALLNTMKAHTRNMMKGAIEDYEKQMKVVYAHFPVNLEVKGDKVLINNFLGEKTPRESKIVAGVKVEVKGQDITIKGFDKEAVGQTASNLVKATGVGDRDARIFQDGIYYAI